MEVSIRKESSKDYKAVFKLLEEAFKQEQMSDHKEQYLVERLRKSEGFVPELSMVAEVGNEIVGYILLSQVKIINDKNEFIALALAPLCVLPKYQKQGIGGRLIKAAHKKAKELGFKVVVVLGHEDYYPKFGYQHAAPYGIEFPAEFPKQNCMLMELEDGGLKDIRGLVEYPKAFFE